MMGEVVRLQPWRPSNGTEGCIFQSGNCWRCIVDHDDGWHNGMEGTKSCPILMDALGDGAKEWWVDVVEPYTVRAYGCDGFKGPCACDTQYPPS